ncbi:hypothetical protein LTR08_004895 [Meristemomyces frigidus]|nr:hypothetical protein LTR08_004895 [Meristemomyces frigidus]
MSTDARAAKNALRTSIKPTLATLSAPALAHQSRTAQALIAALPQYRAAQRISIYLSMPTREAQTDALLRQAFADGKDVFVPYIHAPAAPATSSEAGTEKARKGKGKVMAMLRLHSIAELSALDRDAWGIPTLPAPSLHQRDNALGGSGPAPLTHDVESESTSARGLDLIVVPGVAFDPSGARVGHGAGFYDSFLTRCCADGEGRRPYLVGLCLAEQMLPLGEIAMQAWDWRVDVVAVGDGRLLECGEGGLHAVG